MRLLSVLRQIPQPLYQRVKEHILELITQGHLPSDGRIPSENMLVQQLKVSRMTIHRALRELAAEGLLVRIQGVGTFVAPHKSQSTLLEIISIAEEIRRRGGAHSSIVHLQQREQTSGPIAAQMGLAPGTEVYHAVLVHCEDGVPVQLADRYVNPTIAPEFIHQDFSAMTPAEYLLRVAPVSQVEHVIEAVLADKKSQTLLNLKKNTPCLLLHRTTWSDEMVATHSRLTYPGPRYRLGGRFQPGSNSRCPVV